MRQIATEQMDKIKIAILSDSDVIAARQRGRALAQRVGFDSTDTIFISTLISEMARAFVSQALPGTISVAATEEAGKVGITVVASVCLEKNASGTELPHLPPLMEPKLLSRAVSTVGGIHIFSKPHETTLTMMKRGNGNRAPYPLMMG